MKRTKLQAYVDSKFDTSTGKIDFTDDVMDRLQEAFVFEVLNTGYFYRYGFVHWVSNVTPSQLEEQFNSHEIMELYLPYED